MSPLSLRSADPLPRRRDLPARLVGEELIVKDPSSGRVHLLNQTGAVVWECCDGSITLAECARRLAERFPAAGPEVEADVRELVERLAGEGLFQPLAADGA